MTQHDLDKFIEAQDAVYGQVCSELAAGRKLSHWMWFIFPQLRGLGSSPMAMRYALASREGAVAYWQHPILGARLKECTRLVLAVEGKSAFDIFGKPDDLKFRSCLTLFAQAVPGEALFTQALSRFCAGQQDERTLALLA